MMDDIQTLEKKLAESSDLKEKIQGMNALALALRYSNQERALALGREAVALSSETERKEEFLRRCLAESLYTLGSLHVTLANFGQALEQFSLALAEYEAVMDKTQIANTLGNLGMIYGNLGDFSEAFQYMFQVLEMAQDMGDEMLLAKTLNNIGYALTLLNEPDKALPYLKKSLQILRNLDERNAQTSVLDSLCHAYRELGVYESALENGLQSLLISQELGIQTNEAEYSRSVGKVYLAMGDDEQALIFFQRSLEIARTVGFKLEISQSLRMIGDVYCRREQFDRAVNYLKQALEIAKEIDIKRLLYQSHQSLADVYKQVGDFEAALFHYEQFHAYKETIFNTETDQRVKHLEIIHQVQNAKKDSEIYRLRNVELQQEIEERKKVQTALEQLATTDPLTGLFNRRHFYFLAEREFNRTVRYHHSLSLIMMDIDHFKTVNDEHGHLVGDRVLVEIADRIREGLRSSDVPARYGGEEFVIILPNTGLEQAHQVANRIWSAIVKKPISTKKTDIYISASLGVAHMSSGEAETIETLLDWADQALYQAKETGRNQVLLYK